MATPRLGKCPPGDVRLPQSPEESMEFLSRSWSASAAEVSRAITPRLSMLSKFIARSSVPAAAATVAAPATAHHTNTAEQCRGETAAEASGIPFSLASSATTQLVLERILMSQSSVEVSPLTSGRLSHSSEPLIVTENDSPPFSPSKQLDDVVKLLHLKNNPPSHLASSRASATTASGGMTMGRWLKDRKERKKEEMRAHNAQVHAAVTVAGVAAAVAAIAAATAASSGAKKEQQMAKMDAAVASAATLVAAQCVEAAEAMGAEREQLATAISSAVNISSYGDIMTLNAAAATALRGAATLKARVLKEVWNAAAVLPVEKSESDASGRLLPAEDFLSVCSLELLARGCELLKRTRKGDLHWKFVSVYLNTTGQVILKMKSKHIGRTITKTNKNVVVGVCKGVAAWPGRHLFEGAEQRRYFGLKTEGRGVVEFECRNMEEYNIWTQGVSRLLSIVAERNHTNYGDTV